MFELSSTDEFTVWLEQVDREVRKRVLVRLARAEMGNLGDHKLFGPIGEMRIDFGPGYRVYFTKREQRIIVLLCGGDKKTQRRDIARATLMAAEVQVAALVTRPFSIADHLDDEGQSFMLDDAIAANDPAYLAHAIGTIARARGGLLTLERRTGIKRQTLAKSFGPDGNPTLATLLPVLKALGLKLSIEPADPAPVAA